ncbi:MAG: preprotein translocase subunit SecG [Desulfovibrionales bacterium]
MSALIITLHILACVFLVILVLLQSGKEGMGVIFGGSSGSLFGSSGAGGLLSKLTIGAAVVFFVTSLTLTYLSSVEETAEQPSVVLETMPLPEGEHDLPDEPLENEAGQNGEESVTPPSPGSDTPETAPE